jgi:putative metalloprotease
MARAYLALIVILSLFSVGCEDTDVGMALQTGADAVRAVTLDDEDVQRLAVEVAQQSDRKHEVAPPARLSPASKTKSATLHGPLSVH